MTWLQSVGKVVGRAFSWLGHNQSSLQAIGGMVAGAVGGAPGVAIDTALAIESVVVGAEATIMEANSGAQKLAVAAPIVGQIIMASPLSHNRHIADQAKWDAAVQKITSGFADLANSYEAVDVTH